MKVGDNEFYQLLAFFEKESRKKFYGRLDREDKSLWSSGVIYQDGNMNNLFIAFRLGYQLAKSIAQQEEQV